VERASKSSSSQNPMTITTWRSRGFRHPPVATSFRCCHKGLTHYEPKDDALSATPLSVGQGVTANIMDSKDVDWYRLSAIGKSLTVSLDNQSATLRPSVSAFDSNRSQIGSQHYDSTPGANLKFVFVDRSREVLLFKSRRLFGIYRDLQPFNAVTNTEGQ
jgi:hypothetical protein